MKKIKKGFTLIELLIVIALLGALAVALLAALDPLEQIKKGTDTGVRNTVTEIQSSFIRYAAINGATLPSTTFIPWGSLGYNVTSAASAAIQKAIDAGELKSDFFSLSQNQLSSIYMIADAQKIYACFAPTAKSFKTDANTKFMPIAGATSATMTEGTNCVNGSAGSTVCYWCMR